MLMRATTPRTAARAVPTTVKAPTRASTTLARAKPLVRSCGGGRGGRLHPPPPAGGGGGGAGGGGRSGGTSSAAAQSGQGMVWPAKVSSTSKPAPQEQDSDGAMTAPSTRGDRAIVPARPAVGLPAVSWSLS